MNSSALCSWCKGPIHPTARLDSRFCCRQCRQSAWRVRRACVAEDLVSSPTTRVTSDVSPGPGVSKLHQRRAGNGPLRLAYADPPYPGTAYLYRGHPDYAGEVDHKRLLEQLDTYDGWALSTSRKALRYILPLTPEYTCVCPWVKPHGHAPAMGPSNVHEYVLVSPARRKLPGVRDALYAAVARGGGSDLIGRKPIAFCAWLFALLGAEPKDSFEDLFPGSGMVGRCWEEFCRLWSVETVAR